MLILWLFNHSHQKGKSLAVFQLLIEKLNSEAKHKFFRYDLPHFLRIYLRHVYSYDVFFYRVHAKTHHENKSSRRRRKHHHQKHQEPGGAAKKGSSLTFIFHIFNVVFTYVLFHLKSCDNDLWFEGTRLVSLLRDIIVLPQGHETDLLHGMDRWTDPVYL